MTVARGMSIDTLAPALRVDDATADLLFREARTTRDSPTPR
ncbi:hypothetical protein [Cellulosimicrobium sp. CUA-896]